MILKNGKITFLIGEESSTLELKDGDAGITFARVTLSATELARLLSRRAYISCDMSLFGLDKVGKKMIHKPHVFDITGIPIPVIKRDAALDSILQKTLPEGWVSDNYYGSKDSFFEKEGKKYARVTIRAWVDITE